MVHVVTADWWATAILLPNMNWNNFSFYIWRVSSPKLQKNPPNIFSHLPVVVSNPADSFGFISRGYEIYVWTFCHLPSARLSWRWVEFNTWSSKLWKIILKKYKKIYKKKQQYICPETVSLWLWVIHRMLLCTLFHGDYFFRRKWF